MTTIAPQKERPSGSFFFFALDDVFLVCRRRIFSWKKKKDEGQITQCVVGGVLCKAILVIALPKQGVTYRSETSLAVQSCS